MKNGFCLQLFGKYCKSELKEGDIVNKGETLFTVEAMKTILMGWSTFAFACRQPFFIIPGEYCTEDTDMSSALSWAMPKKVTETRDGLFTLFGTEIIPHSVHHQQATQTPFRNLSPYYNKALS